MQKSLDKDSIFSPLYLSLWRMLKNQLIILQRRTINFKNSSLEMWGKYI